MKEEVLISPSGFEKPIDTYKFLQKYDYLEGYSIKTKEDEKLCDTCKEKQGKYFSEFKEENLPPFHPNCRCEIEFDWRKNVDQYALLEMFYDPFTGEIKRGATREIIVEMVNHYLGIDTTWEDIALVSFFNDNFGTTDPADLIGEYTFVGINYKDGNHPNNVIEIGFEMNKLFNEVENSVSKIGDRDFWDYINFDWQFRPHGEFDVKNGNDPVFTSHPRNHFAYIYNGKLIRYDSPGNILVGYASAHAGFSSVELLLGANLDNVFDYSIKNWLGGGDEPWVFFDAIDDHVDQDYIIKGYRLYSK